MPCHRRRETALAATWQTDAGVPSGIKNLSRFPPSQAGARSRPDQVAPVSGARYFGESGSAAICGLLVVVHWRPVPSSPWSQYPCAAPLLSILCCFLSSRAAVSTSGAMLRRRPLLSLMCCRIPVLIRVWAKICFRMKSPYLSRLQMPLKDPSAINTELVTLGATHTRNRTAA